MIRIIVGTNRQNSKSSQVAALVDKILKKHPWKTEVLNLQKFPFSSLNDRYSKEQAPEVSAWIDKVCSAEGLVFVVPEYNGSFPGALKSFIDHWRFPESFEFRPMCFIGLGGRFGAYQAVAHLQQVFLYRSGFIYPERVLISNIEKVLVDGKLTDTVATALLESQMNGFVQFVDSIKKSGLHANDRLKK